MAKPLVDDELWNVVETLLPKRPMRPKVGKPPADDRTCLAGILFVLKTGIAWEDFPGEMGCCGMTLLNRLRQWQRLGVWDRAYHSEPHRRTPSVRAIATEIARRNMPHGSGLGVYRWFVEQTLALMHQFKRLRTMLGHGMEPDGIRKQAT